MLYLVVDVEVSLTGVLGHNTTLLQQEVGNPASVRSAASAELDLKLFALCRGQSLASVSSR